MCTSNRKKFDSLHMAVKSTGHWGKKTYLQPSVNWTYHLYGALIPTLKILLYINTLSFYEFFFALLSVFATAYPCISFGLIHG